jgi:hypothetical protein
VVRREPQRIEVLVDGHDWWEVVVVLESGKSRLDQLSRQRERMIWLQMKSSARVRQDRRRHVGPLITIV